MAIKLITLKCPECGAKLQIENDRHYCYCTYCGSKILLNNENEYIIRHIDEADIKRAENELISDERKYNLEKEKMNKSSLVKILIAYFIMLTILSIFIILKD